MKHLLQRRWLAAIPDARILQEHGFGRTYLLLRSNIGASTHSEIFRFEGPRPRLQQLLLVHPPTVIPFVLCGIRSQQGIRKALDPAVRKAMVVDGRRVVAVVSEASRKPIVVVCSVVLPNAPDKGRRVTLLGDPFGDLHGPPRCTLSDFQRRVPESVRAADHADLRINRFEKLRVVRRRRRIRRGRQHGIPRDNVVVISLPGQRIIVFVTDQIKPFSAHRWIRTNLGSSKQNSVKTIANVLAIPAFVGRGHGRCFVLANIAQCIPSM